MTDRKTGPDAQPRLESCGPPRPRPPGRIATRETIRFDRRTDNLLAIDPGTRESGWVRWNHQTKRPTAAGIDSNGAVLEMVGDHDGPTVIEMVDSYGMPVGREVFETVLWIGRMFERAKRAALLPRRQVKLHLCDTSRAKDANVNQVVKDRIAGWHDIPVRAVKGLKAAPGPVYGFRSHMWSALALAITWAENEESKR